MFYFCCLLHVKVIHYKVADIRIATRTRQGHGKMSNIGIFDDTAISTRARARGVGDILQYGQRLSYGSIFRNPCSHRCKPCCGDKQMFLTLRDDLYEIARKSHASERNYVPKRCSLSRLLSLHHIFRRFRQVE